MFSLGGNNVVGSRAGYGIRLTWSALPWSASNGRITGYRIYWRESLMANRPYENATSNATSHWFDGVKLGEK